MHQLFIIHADIKDINMMYSPTYKKIVFIDFGTAYCLNNGAGHTTIIKKFFGTPFFSSP
jgi:serine/threonine protein kinase